MPTYEYVMPVRKDRQTSEWIVRCYVVTDRVRRYPDGDCYESSREDAQASYDALVRHETARRESLLPEYSI